MYKNFALDIVPLQPLTTKDSSLSDYQKGLLRDRRPDYGVNDETPRRSANAYNPLNHWEYMSRGTQDAFAEEGLMLGDLTPDDRGWNPDPNFRKMTNYSWQSSKKIEQSLQPREILFSIIDSMNDKAQIQSKFQESWNISKKYLKIFDESLINTQFVAGPSLVTEKKLGTQQTQQSLMIKPEVHQSPLQRIFETKNATQLAADIIKTQHSARNETINSVQEAVKQAFRAVQSIITDDARAKQAEATVQPATAPKQTEAVLELTNKQVGDHRRPVGEYADLLKSTMSPGDVNVIKLIDYCIKHKEQAENFIRSHCSSVPESVRAFLQLSDMPIKQQCEALLRIRNVNQAAYEQLINFALSRNGQLLDQIVKSEREQATKKSMNPSQQYYIAFEQEVQHKLLAEKVNAALSGKEIQQNPRCVLDLIDTYGTKFGASKLQLTRIAAKYARLLNTITGQQIGHTTKGEKLTLQRATQRATTLLRLAAERDTRQLRDQQEQTILSRISRVVTKFFDVVSTAPVKVETLQVPISRQIVSQTQQPQHIVTHADQVLPDRSHFITNIGKKPLKSINSLLQGDIGLSEK